jgi:hypothetical protein
MKKHLTDAEIKKLFTNPYSLRKTIKLWKDVEKGGMEFVRNVKEERKKLLERTTK